MNMTKLPKPASNFLRPEDVDDGDVVEVVGHLETIPAEDSKYGKERHIIPVQFKDGTEKRWGLNTTSYRTLYESFGDEGDNWISKQVKVVKNREKVRGETRYVLYAEPADTPAKQASLETDNDFRKKLDKLGIKPEAFNALSGAEQAKLLKKLAMQQ